MNMKEVGEIRRRIRRDRSNMNAIYGCYVNSQKEIICEFKRSTGMMPENESEKYFTMMKKVLSGSIGKNLLDITFKTSQVADSPEHRLLMRLRDSQLADEQAREELYQKIIEAVSFSDNYVILLGSESYDVPFKSKDDNLQRDGSDEVYTYVLCAVCPVKLSKGALLYDAKEKVFADGGVHQEACVPQMGFLFPAFDQRRSNIYNALYYTRSAKDNHEAFVDAVFHTAVAKPAVEQKRSFEALLNTTLDEACTLEVMQTVHEQLCQSIELHKESKVADPLLVSKEQVSDALSMCGVPEENVAKFRVKYDEVFGSEAQLHPKNIIDHRRFEIKTPDISIQVNPQCSDLIETRIIGGVKYLMICADENVEVNGVPIHILQKQE